LNQPPPVNWCDPPDPYELNTRLCIVCAPPHGHLDFVLLNDLWHGAPIHWIDQRTTPCTKGNGCRCETEDIPARWKAWIGATSYQTRRIVLVEVTAAALLAAGLDTPALGGKILRGLSLRISRDKATKTGRVVAELLDRPRVPANKMPDPPNVRLELSRIWYAPR